MDDDRRNRLVSNVVGHLKSGVSAPLLERAMEYRHSIDKKNGGRGD
jgi:catalase